VYGLGHAEEVVSRQNLALAEALKPVAGTLRDIPQADRPYVFTKCSLVWDESDHSVPPRRLGSRPLPRPGSKGPRTDCRLNVRANPRRRRGRGR
jgi:hypothetical protein